MGDAEKSDCIRCMGEKLAVGTADLYHIIPENTMGEAEKNNMKTAWEQNWLSALPTQLIDIVLYGESLCDPHRGALYRRAPLSEKRSTGSFYQIHPCGAPKV